MGIPEQKHTGLGNAVPRAVRVYQEQEHISLLLHGHWLSQALNPHLVSYFAFWDSGSIPGTAEKGAGDQVELFAGSKTLQEYHHTHVRGLYW